MHSRQHLLLLKQGAQSPSDYWIMTSKAQSLLFTRVNGALFAPEGFEEHIHIESNVGVVHSSTLKKNFLNVNFEVLQQFLVYNEFCQKIEDQETLELIQGSSHNSSNAADIDVETTQEHASETAVMEVQLTTGERLSIICLLYTSPSPRDATLSRMPSSA